MSVVHIGKHYRPAKLTTRRTSGEFSSFGEVPTIEESRVQSALLSRRIAVLDSHIQRAERIDAIVGIVSALVGLGVLALICWG